MASEFKHFLRQSSIPDKFDEKTTEVRGFIQSQIQNNRRVVVVTSGGTKVPLESKTVRYLDNFSVGSRGSTSTEYFHKEGYAVIFLHRKGSLRPYQRHLTHQNFLDILQVNPETTPNIPRVSVKPQYENDIIKTLSIYKSIREQNMLCEIEFQTLSEYLQLLHICSLALEEVGNKGLMYLAAAVSDFYIPKEEMPQHKIQSSSGPLQISLQLVPKMLSPLVKEWAPSVFVVSFKLETDKSILVSKAKSALNNYKHQVVVANLLETRKKEVILVTKDSEEVIQLTDTDINNGKEIEEIIVQQLKTKHNQFCS
ncbi:hypothetical protein KUTeg_003112 [Tegillarca granosa]|uniref:DNA/pantothenate metabolism flavoprotein C-terminal domain-containing protein n=1 Tax=Tegillarca granosa TaxID=220873 RepID=A0ABQ9FL68_TEGGR|nr:hypothetical protein KUTeg_003112 [Tegillarca granosa]